MIDIIILFIPTCSLKYTFQLTCKNIKGLLFFLQILIKANTNMLVSSLEHSSMFKGLNECTEQHNNTVKCLL